MWRAWLQKDVLPPREDLYNMVRFLVAQLGEHQDVRHWEAFLIYGPGVVSSPVDHLLYREDQGRRDIATMIFAQVSDRYKIPPSAYDAEEAFQRCLDIDVQTEHLRVARFPTRPPGALQELHVSPCAVTRPAWAS